MGNPNDYRFVIIPKSEYHVEMLNSAVEGSLDEVLKTTSGTEMYLFRIRPGRDEVFIGYDWYTDDGIAVELAKAEWAGTQ